MRTLLYAGLVLLSLQTAALCADSPAAPTIYMKSNLVVCGSDGFVYVHDGWKDKQAHFAKMENSEDLCKLLVAASPFEQPKLSTDKDAK